jgi:hypothetical protein
MKTIKFLFTVMSVAIVAIATAIEKPQMNVLFLDSNKALVAMQNNNEAIFELNVYNENGNVVYYKTSSKPVKNDKQVFDFTSLEQGNYSMCLRVKDTQIIKKFEVNSNKISFGKAKLKVDPFFSFKNDELKFSYLNYDRDIVTMIIYNGDRLIYKKVIGSDFTITKGFDFSKLKSGSYEVVLSTENNQYSYCLAK